MDIETEVTELKHLVRENQRLLIESNQLIKKIRTREKVITALHITWFAVLFGAPIALYYLLLEPNIDNLKRSLEVIETGAKNATGFKEIFEQAKPGAPTE